MPTTLTDEQLSLRGQIGANSRWANTRRRAALDRTDDLQEFEDLVDPDRVLPATERIERATNARCAQEAREALAESRLNASEVVSGTAAR